MAPKVRRGSIPVPIQAMKNKLGDDLTADSFERVDNTTRSNAFKAMDRYMKVNHSEQFGEYQKIQEFEKKREWMASFITDGDEGVSRMINKFCRQVTQRTSPASNPIPRVESVLNYTISRIACSDSGLLYAAIIFRAIGHRRCGG
jgi:hypothetical protein